MSRETQSGLDPWEQRELPEAPRPKGLQWMSVVGPGVIVLGLSIGSGEFLLGPATFVKHGLSLLWVAAVAVLLQTFFNLELMRYTMATGEPAITGFMRTKPSARLWAIFYALLYFLQSGWPAWAATASGAIFFLFAGTMATPADANTAYYIGCASFLVCVFVLQFGKRIERTLEILNWVMVGCVLLSFVLLAAFFVPAKTWLAGGLGMFGYDLAAGGFNFLPEGVDFVLLAALAGYAGAGGVANITLSNWARDKGYGMSEHAGYIPASVGGQKVNLAHTGFRFVPTPEAMARWRGWWRIVKVDQWGIFFAGAMLGMVLPAIIYVRFLPPGNDIRGLGIAAALASNVGATAGAMLASGIAFLAAWILLKTQLDQVESITRAVTDIIWTGSKRVRARKDADVRKLYYAVLAAVAVWGMIALRLAQPVVLLQLGANVAGAVFIVASLHLLYINTTLLPPELRPGWGRRAALVFMAIFYSFFVYMSVSRLLSA
jgi:hypothetical protein